MQLSVRWCFWSAHLGMVATAAFLVASMVDLVLERVIAPGPSQAIRIGNEQQTSREPPAVLDLPRLAQLMGIALPPGAPLFEREGDQSAQPTRSGIQVKLLGTLLSSSTGWSIASVLDLPRQRTSTVMEGDRLHDALVVTILRDRVIILRDGRREFFGFDPAQGPPERSAETATRTGAGPAAIRPLDGNEYEISRSALQETLSQPEPLTQARIAPSYKDGQLEGFKLFAIRPDSLYSKLGFVNGDVIRRINGFEMKTPENALEVYARLKDANRIEVELVRDGSSIRKSYSIR